jgi:hypothetical protein
MKSLILSCPRISPQWELAAQLALVKPKAYTKSKIAYSTAIQPWPRDARQIIEEAIGAVGSLQFPRTGDQRMIADLVDLDLNRGKRLARKISRLLPELWFTLDSEGKSQGYFRDGVFYQRTGRYNLELVRASRMRLRRAVRFGFLGDLDHAIPRPHRRAGQNAPAQ